MTTAALIDAVISYTDNSSSSDGDNALRRLRMLQWCQERFEEIWYFRQWPFRARTGTVTVAAAANSGDLPSDFAEIGDQGGVYDGVIPLTEISQQQLVTERQSGNRMLSSYVYAIFDYNSSTLRKKIQTLTLGATTAFDLNYLSAAPTLADSTGATNNLDDIPVQYHQTVILPAVVARARMSIGDDRDFENNFMRGLAHMVAQERGRKNIVRRLPLSRGMW